jgi:hypothetical protein
MEEVTTQTAVPLSKVDANVFVCFLYDASPQYAADIFDAQLAATMLEHGIQRIYTFNVQDFEAFEELYAAASLRLLLFSLYRRTSMVPRNLAAQHYPDSSCCFWSPENMRRSWDSVSGVHRARSLADSATISADRRRAA